MCQNFIFKHHKRGKDYRKIAQEHRTPIKIGGDTFKNLKMFGSLLLTVMLLTACASTNNGGVTDASSQSANTYDRVIEVANPVSLAHLVARAPGVSLDFSRGIPKV